MIYHLKGSIYSRGTLYSGEATYRSLKKITLNYSQANLFLDFFSVIYFTKVTLALKCLLQSC